MNCEYSRVHVNLLTVKYITVQKANLQTNQLFSCICHSKTAIRVCNSLNEQLDEASAYIKALETKLTEQSLQKQQRVSPAESAPTRPQQQPYAPSNGYQPQPPPAASQHQSRLRARDESAPPVSAGSSSRRVHPDGRFLEGSAAGDELTDRPLPSSSRVSELQHMIEARDTLIREDRQLMHQSLATLSSCIFYLYLSTSAAIIIFGP